MSEADAATSRCGLAFVGGCARVRLESLDRSPRASGRGVDHARGRQLPRARVRPRGSAPRAGLGAARGGARAAPRVALQREPDAALGGVLRAFLRGRARQAAAGAELLEAEPPEGLRR